MAVVEPLENRTLMSVTVEPFTPSDGLTGAIATNGRRIVVGTEVAADADNAYLDLYDYFGRRVTRMPLTNGAIPGDAEVRDVAMAANGSFVAVWTQQYNDERGFFVKTAVHARRFAADGQPVTPRVKVFTAHSRLGSNALMPSIAINDAREFVVAYNWREDAESDGAENIPKQNVAAKMYKSNGERRHAVDVASGIRDESDSDVAMRPQGRGFDIVYTLEDKSDDTDGRGPVVADTDIVLARYRSDGTLRQDGIGRRKVAATAFEEFSPAISISPDGSERIVGWNRTIPGQAAGRRSARQYTNSELGERFNVGPFGTLRDIATSNTGVSVAVIEDLVGRVIEDPENLTSGSGATVDVTPGIIFVPRASVAVGANGCYAAVFVEEADDDELVLDGYLMMGTLPETP